MSCPSRRSGHPYTRNQREHLQGLLDAGALSRETAVAALRRGLNPLVVGALRDRYLADSRAIRRQGRSWTEYWLTEQGVAEAQKLASGQAADHG